MAENIKIHFYLKTSSAFFLFLNKLLRVEKKTNCNSYVEEKYTYEYKALLVFCLRVKKL